MNKRIKNIFFAHPSLKQRGGAEKIIFSLANHFAGNHQIFILSEDRKKDFGNLKLDNKIRYCMVPYGSKNIFKIILSFIFIFYYLSRYKPDIVHSHHRRVTLLFSLFRLLFFLQFKLIHTSHNIFEYGKLFKFAQCDTFTAVGENVEKNLIDFFGFKKEKVKLIYNGIEEYRKDSLPVERNSAVVIGRLTQQKGHIYLLEAWKEVRRHIPDAVLYIVGEGRLRKELEKYVAKSGLSKNIFFVGFSSDPFRWILKTEVCVLPSLWEGLPLFILEAFSVKRTIVTTAVDGVPEIVHDKTTGLLVPPKNPKDLAEAILYMFREPLERKRMAENGYKLFKEKFTIDKMLAQYQELYKAVAAL